MYIAAEGEKMGLPLTYQGLRVDENADNPEDYCCCPICGSLGVMHFEDKDEGETSKPHVCIKCTANFIGCKVSLGRTPKDRMLSCTNREDFKAIL